VQVEEASPHAVHTMLHLHGVQVEEATAQSLASAAGLWQALSDEWLPHRRPEVLAKLWHEVSTAVHVHTRAI